MNLSPDDRVQRISAKPVLLASQMTGWTWSLNSPLLSRDVGPLPYNYGGQIYAVGELAFLLAPPSLQMNRGFCCPGLSIFDQH